jgi:ABC-2 type transport system ATP-binding protein
MALTISKLFKSYGNNNALDNINLTCDLGWVYCLLGRNGAGKSTLINIIANLIEPTSGGIVFNDLDYTRNEIEIKKQIGLLSQYDQLVGDLNARDYLQWVGLLYGLSKTEVQKQIANLLNFFFDNDEDLSGACAGYSSGMKKKLTFCAAVIHKPNLLLLDEPFANLDPVAANKLCDFLIAYKNSSRLLFVSSHDLLYVDKIATHIGIINNASFVYNDSMSHFKDGGPRTLDQELLKYLQPKNNHSSLLESII